VIGRRSSWIAAAVAAALSAAALPGVAADATAGRRKAQPCSVCHGVAGLSSAPDTPHLAGQPEGYVARQLQAFRNGKRQHEIMSLMAKPLTDDDIGDLALWYASLVVEVKAPP
jgi:cytochrome c553